MDAKKKELGEALDLILQHVLVEHGEGAEGCEVCKAVATLREFSAALAQPAQGEVKFLLDGTRLKLSFQEVECDHCGETVHGSLVAVPLDQYADELNGRWVALVPAENDQHLSQPPADTIAVHECEWREINTADLTDDLVWLFDGVDSIEGPRPLEGNDYDRYAYWAPVTWPSTLAIKSTGEDV